MMHSKLATGRWQQMSIADQLGNVGSEYSRILSSRRRQDEARFQGALSRFLELLDLTINDERWDLGRKRELLRLREISCKGFPEGLQKYFNHFALLARKNK
ncbi:MAG: hypothetical protein A3C85_03385 [Candidatus Doudnabacteria bacterium RIFCSPHIGHO2_02_FULL_48_21]|uniref:Uncharacterized protein n=1 Tax=Candidatus Doudnabacteria bacterium RIFCSPLOWO2_02_FULL_48_13 TaxID=1817845 RepID=A0A1F5QAY2_9BACT|nr:MAG: hypothetical protein A3K05_03735 [Candidatus Doudnabacteria bacterium RIFCSPHIGHO2_01_48_18]OGE91435.1 MAG: hypothetical protein A3F44_00785 [Candidatus Doudnabacteria bacterium RIFCSPHIGHO2_12_FULL_47_25]OGE93283.1 MAG: hypothetical protein A3C85_03385 [Candidatus Doudnabacteria bacterium RIFCSPHIGHO2_02_FULL_48_21]OGE96827.1 MAG: hypothetical protein A3A83_02185 [Candidatus Doudnabacteria bacterium RIFCSPLOWO2_01_FULL_48_57]OGE99353.1 MAG: hypothetical protein A3J05_00365 [Candidatus 